MGSPIARAASEPRQEPGRIRTSLELLGLVLPPSALVTALLFYFGFARTQAEGAYFGIDTSVLGFSTQDYLLRSVGTTFWSASAVLLAILAAGLLHSFVIGWVEHPRTRRRAERLAAVVGTVGLVSFGFGLVNILWRPVVTQESVFLVPLSLMTGVALCSYAGYLIMRIRDRRATTQAPDSQVRLSRSSVGVLATLLLLGAFWTVGDYAAREGHRQAIALASNIAALPSVVLYSRTPLFIDGVGVEEATLSSANGSDLFRYAGLRLLIHAQGKYFLLPDGWTRGSGVVVVLPDSEAVRLDFAAG